MNAMLRNIETWKKHQHRSKQREQAQGLIILLCIILACIWLCWPGIQP